MLIGFVQGYEELKWGISKLNPLCNGPNMLLSKIQTLGASGRMLQWFFSYLNRTQCVRHNGKVSMEQKFVCGIPQGSCLGPTLFLFYINDVFTHIDNNVRMLMFADDCVLYKSDICCGHIL